MKKGISNFAATWFLAVAFLISLPQLSAQEGNFADGEAPAATVEKTSLWKMIQDGGWAMYPLGLLSMGSLGLIIFNAINVREKSFIPRSAVDELRPAMESLNIEKAIQVCQDNPTPMTKIVQAGLERISGDAVDPEQIEKAMVAASEEEMSAPYIFVNYLQSIAAVAPMVGLLGTVSGMIKAFQTISSQGLGDSAAMAGNISEALVTTATGLIVAIPALLAYFYFKNKFGKISAKMTRFTDDLFFGMFKSAQAGIQE